MAFQIPRENFFYYFPPQADCPFSLSSGKDKQGNKNQVHPPHPVYTINKAMHVQHHRPGIPYGSLRAILCPYMEISLVL